MFNGETRRKLSMSLLPFPIWSTEILTCNTQMSSYSKLKMTVCRGPDQTGFKRIILSHSNCVLLSFVKTTFPKQF